MIRLLVRLMIHSQLPLQEGDQDGTGSLHPLPPPGPKQIKTQRSCAMRERTETVQDKDGSNAVRGAKIIEHLL